MGPGKVFGELAILYNCKRTASIRGNCRAGNTETTKKNKFTVNRSFITDKQTNKNHFRDHLQPDWRL